MLRGIFLYVASTPPSRRRGVRHASTQSIKSEAAVRQHVQNAQPAWVLARRGCAFWQDCLSRGNLFARENLPYKTSKLQRPSGASRVALIVPGLTAGATFFRASGALGNTPF